MNIPLAHTMGGEVSGTIDESVRHAVTKLAHIHFPASRQAGERIIRMGEDPATVHVVGCPRMDLAKEILEQDGRHPGEWIDWQEGVGVPLDLSGPFLVAAQYPVTSEYGDGERQINETLKALEDLRLPTIMLWPNADAGAEDVARGMRKFRERLPDLDYIHFFKNLPVEVYLRLLSHAACIVGNTSSAIREGAFLGTPSVNIGTRQQGRERGQNVVDVPYNHKLIQKAVERQVCHGRYSADPVYGDGQAGERIARILNTCGLDTQKRLSY
jgi:UDP-hydrolysing UDP-N-acetyl-D-glucosamine 2-epimerase